MDIESFIVQDDKSKRDPIDDRWTIPVTRKLRAQISSLSKSQRGLFNESTRRFLAHLIEVYSKDQSKAS